MNAHRSGLRTSLKLVVHTYGKNKRKVIIKNAGASLIYSNNRNHYHCYYVVQLDHKVERLRYGTVGLNG